MYRYPVVPPRDPPKRFQGRLRIHSALESVRGFHHRVRVAHGMVSCRDLISTLLHHLHPPRCTRSTPFQCDQGNPLRRCTTEPSPGIWINQDSTDHVKSHIMGLECPRPGHCRFVPVVALSQLHQHSVQHPTIAKVSTGLIHCATHTHSATTNVDRLTGTLGILSRSELTLTSMPVHES